MKQICKIFFLLFCFCSITKITAQIPDGSIAPDFMVTDIEGQTHHLYEYLDQGKTVILEIGATWCEPCWSYTKTKVLDEIHQMLGTEGLDNTVLLFIEGEPDNTTEQLYGELGTTGNIFADHTYGNWVAEIDYPIIDNHEIADLYAVKYYPSIFKICPNDKTTTELGQLSVDRILDETINTDCMSPTSSDDLAILRYPGTTSVCDNTGLKFPIEIVNLGSNPIYDATISIEDAQNHLMTVALETPLAPLERQVIGLGPITLDKEGLLMFTVQNNLDNNPHNNFLTQHIALAKTSNSLSINLELFTDAYGYETYWQIQDLDGTILHQGGNLDVGINNGGWPYINEPNGEGAYNSFDHIVHHLELPQDGCYEFVIVDDYGDGICCEYGHGSYKISDQSGKILIEDGRFSDKKTHPFSIVENISTSTLEATTETIFQCYPNPTSQFVNIRSISSADDIYVEIIDIQGQKKGRFALLKPNESIDISHLSNGLYLFNFYSNYNYIQTSKINILR